MWVCRFGLIVVGAVGLLGCEDPWEPPVDIRGTYELQSISGVSEFPIYVGETTYSTPGGDGVFERWIRSDGPLVIGETRFHLALGIREVYTGGYWDGKVNEYYGTGNYGDWNYSPPLVFFEPRQQQGWVAIDEGEITRDGIVLTVTITTYTGSPIPGPPQEMVFRKVSSEVDESLLF